MTDKRMNLTPKHVEELTILSENVDKVDEIIQHYNLQNEDLELTPADYEEWVTIAVNNEGQEESTDDDEEDDLDDDMSETEDEDDNEEMPPLVPRR